ncbi:UDP-glucose 4-epimerase protein [Marine Group I thaumarchaeote SCGC AAA799-P11]|uniref:UDP-glucose 4-epimerase protein n=1 Tax=Marine Group I thaumarchaeote SCGC AAA799-P11 TaxID=1502295 RepID=A0A087RYG5_9ARCH|nr:UDP-glucose 4-epimerase protein [Marine Group I thaumarchaeote SCGC AAA799-P11]
MKILILGSEGFVGNNLVEGLSKNHEIFCADMLENSSHKNYKQFNVTDYTSVENTVKNVDVVIDLVAHPLVSSIEGPAKNAEINIIGLLHVLDACVKNQIKKIIFTSASSMIGEPTTPSVSESHTAIPKTAYGITKLASEHYLRLYNELHNLNYVIFRFFNIYGPHQKNGLIPSLYSRITQNQPLTVFGKGDQIRDYVFIRDIIPFFEKAATTNIGDNQIFNMGTGKGASILDVINILSETIQIQPEIEFKEVRPGEIGNFVSDPRLLESTFGDVPSTPLQEGIRQTVNWFKDN